VRDHPTSDNITSMQPLSDFLPDVLPADPLLLTARWLQDAYDARSQPNPNAMVLATVDAGGRPSARVVLCKEIDVGQGYLSFFTNYESRKGQDLAQDGRAAVVMHWDALHRQLRFEGQVRPAPTAESDAYFASRPWQRRVGAWASQQSRPLAQRADLVRSIEQTAARFGVPVPGPEEDDSVTQTIPRPPYWGGYHLWIEAVELWTEGGSRLHDRARWQRELQFAAGDHPGQVVGKPPRLGAWQATRLQP
jgi:pyridoxamine 5'-phosphate oxidase